MTTAETGRSGEEAAAAYLRDAGYEIRALNWRHGRYELDIVAHKDATLHIVEVKTRRRGSLTTPEEAITPQKFRALRKAASCYIAAQDEEMEVQFDLAAVEMGPDGSAQVRLIEQAMECHW